MLNNLSRRTKIIVSVVALAISFAFGRYLTPTKTETKIVTITKEVESKQTDKDTNDHKKTVIHEIVKPSGEKDTTTTITDDRSSDTKIDDNKTTDVTKINDKTVTRGDSKVTISALGGYSFDSRRVEYGASVTKPVLGPITLGIYGLTAPEFGVSLGLQF